MKRLLLIILCWPLLLTAQNGVNLSNFSVNAGTVTFNISWSTSTMPIKQWSDTVWVFVDYNAGGVTKRLPLLPGAALTSSAGQIVEEQGNNNGVWVIGNARNAGSFSATVNLLTSVSDAPGACAYASNYRPRAQYNSPTEVLFTGTPMYNIVLEHTGGSTMTIQSNSQYLVPAGYGIVSFTDATGATGLFGCRPMGGNMDFSVPGTIPKNYSMSFTVTEPPIADNASILYKWSAPDFTPSKQEGPEDVFHTTSPSSTGTYRITLTAEAEDYCSISKTKEVTLGDCAIPVLRDLKVSASGFCAGAEGVTFSFDATDKDAQYQLYKNGVATGAILNGTGNAASFTKKFDAGTYTARAEKNSLFCEASMNGSHVITENPLPVAPNIAQPVDVCQNTDNIVFTATNYTGTLAWTANGGGTETDNSVAFSSNLFGTKSVTARSEQSYQGAPTCYSATVTRSAMVYAAPVINTQPKSQGFCSLFASATLTVAATPVNGKNLTYQWKEGEGDGIDVGTNSNAYTATVSKKTDYWVVITNENKCTTTSKKATINLKGGYMAGEIGSGEVCKSGPGQIGNGN